MIWFVYTHQCQSKSEMPKFLEKFGEILKKNVFFFCFPVSNKVVPTLPEIKVNNEKPKVEELYIKPISENEIPAIPEPIDKEDITIIREPTHLCLIKEKDDQEECKFCDRCENCEAKFKKDEAKKKQKKDVETHLRAINYFLFIVFFIIILITELVIWNNIKKN